MRISLFAVAMTVFSCDTMAFEMRADRWIDSCSSSYLCDDFKRDWPKALKGNPTAQKNMTFYFSTGAKGAVKRDLLVACAWEIVLLAARHPETMSFEGTNLRHYCGRDAVGSLDRPISIASDLFGSIYGKPLPPPPWEWAPPVAEAIIPGNRDDVLRAIQTAARLSALCPGGAMNQVRVNEVLVRFGADPKGGAPGGPYDTASIRADTLREMERQGVAPRESNCRGLRSFYGPLGTTISGIAVVPMSPSYPD